MNKTLKQITLTTAAILFAAYANIAAAQAPAAPVAPTASPANPAATPRIDARQAKQQARINQGVASGKVNPQEAARLNAGQQRVAGAKSAAKADGVVTKGERKQITHMQNHQSKNIAGKKHNNR